MGTKRKASAFEEDNVAYQQQPRSGTPSLASSSPLSTSTVQSSNSDAAPYGFHRVEAVPYLNSRTRKRHRDDRPDDEAIHENTLRKLYDAQRFHLDEAMLVSDVLDVDDLCQHKEGEDEDAEMMDDLPEAGLPLKIERNQRSIDAFFGGKSAAQPRGPPGGRPEDHQAGFW
ncbi:hypothetical protein PV04_00597 [Phialophora macrospora]|uniref:Uncharacterized protein n=1 Tax=Phialophora macrospora TaxID=1851006 RepID=A0A0D2G0Y9_9EURO|nr:hypothetical protein PV04_00597 [Phialophora macrospora]